MKVKLKIADREKFKVCYLVRKLSEDRYLIALPTEPWKGNDKHCVGMLLGENFLLECNPKEFMSAAHYVDPSLRAVDEKKVEDQIRRYTQNPLRFLQRINFNYYEKVRALRKSSHEVEYSSKGLVL